MPHEALAKWGVFFIAMAVALINRALKGDVRAFVTIMKFVGETPTELQQMATDDELNLSSWDF